MSETGNLIMLREEWFLNNPTAYEVVTGRTEDYRIQSLRDLIGYHDRITAAKDAEIKSLIFSIDKALGFIYGVAEAGNSETTALQSIQVILEQALADKKEGE